MARLSRYSAALLAHLICDERSLAMRLSPHSGVARCISSPETRHPKRRKGIMNLKHQHVAVAVALLVLGNSAAKAGQTINEAGTLACVNDKWNESEPDKGHKAPPRVRNPSGADWDASPWSNAG
jgi:hypothetical protein